MPQYIKSERCTELSFSNIGLWQKLSASSKNGLHHKDCEPGSGAKIKAGRDSILTNKRHSPKILKQEKQSRPSDSNRVQPKVRFIIEVHSDV